MPENRIYPLTIRKEDPSKLDFIDPVHDNLLEGTLSNSILSLPNAIDMRSNMPPIGDQGSLGSCTGFALCGLLGYLKKKMLFSPLFLYYCEREMINTINSDSGAYLEDGLKVLNYTGVCLESMWPYNSKRFNEKPTTNCYLQASSYKALQVKTIPETLNDFKSCLAKGFPMVFGFAVFKSYESPIVTKTGVIPYPKKNEEMLGGHAAMLVGYDDRKQCFILRNSWGTKWGIKGYGFIPYKYILDQNLTTSYYTIMKTT